MMIVLISALGVVAVAGISVGVYTLTKAETTMLMLLEILK